MSNLLSSMEELCMGGKDYAPDGSPLPPFPEEEPKMESIGPLGKLLVIVSPALILLIVGLIVIL